MMKNRDVNVIICKDCIDKVEELQVISSTASKPENKKNKKELHCFFVVVNSGWGITCMKTATQWKGLQ